VTFQILTGAPGAGKTVVLRGLELAGYGVVEEAATDVIAWRQANGCMEPWKQPDFVDAILDLQIRRQTAADCQGRSVYLDRSPVCTLALCRFLGLTPTERLNQETAPDRLRAFYRPQVLFVQGLGFITPTSLLPRGKFRLKKRLASKAFTARPMKTLDLAFWKSLQRRPPTVSNKCLVNLEQRRISATCLLEDEVRRGQNGRALQQDLEFRKAVAA